MEVEKGKEILLDGHWVTNGELISMLNQFPEDMPLVGLSSLIGDGTVEEYVHKVWGVSASFVSGEDMSGVKNEGLFIEFEDNFSF